MYVSHFFISFSTTSFMINLLPATKGNNRCIFIININIKNWQAYMEYAKIKTNKDRKQSAYNNPLNNSIYIN